jgi:hypothetical protein
MQPTVRLTLALTGGTDWRARWPPATGVTGRTDRSSALLGSGNVHQLAGRRGGRYRFASLAQVLEVEFDRLLHKPNHLFSRVRRRHATGQIWNVRAETRRTLLHNDQVLHFSDPSLPSKAACLSALRRVPGGRSALSLPATVTVPRLLG